MVAIGFWLHSKEGPVYPQKLTVQAVYESVC
jgi:hypothetical protein